MTVCIATSDYLPSENGIATFNKHLTNILTDSGHTAIILTIDYERCKEEDDEVIKSRENKLVIVSLRKTYYRYLKYYSRFFRPGGLNAPNWLAMGYAMRDWLRANVIKYNIDIIEAADYGGFGVLVMQPELPPVILTGHGNLLQMQKHSKGYETDDHFNLITELEKLSYQYADATVTHSPFNVNDLTAIFKRPIALKKMPFVSSNKIENEEKKKSGQILCIGGLYPVKGIEDLLSALMILKDHEPEIKAEWIGSDTWLAPGYKKMSTWLEKKYPEIWGSLFKWLGPQSHKTVLEKIAEAAMIVIPARFETFNYVALEAASYKKAIIITSTTGAAYLFIDGKSACIVPPSDPVSLAKAITRLRTDSNLCGELGENAVTKVASLFNPDDILNERIELYKATIGKRRLNKNSADAATAIIKKYITPQRWLLYRIKALLKKIISPLIK